jgi:DNA-directed RNA polymerase specialized sigma24 family protein
MEDEDRTDRLLALILLNQMKAAPQREKIVQLNLAGFSNVEIADMLQITSAAVSQVLYESRKGGKQKTKKISKQTVEA